MSLHLIKFRIVLPLSAKKFYLEKPLNEVDFLISAYSKNISRVESFVEENVKFCSKIGLKISERETCLPIMCWMPKMHKSSKSNRFIVALQYKDR